MKFEDLYKKSNDSIHPDRNMIDKLFEEKQSKSFFTPGITATVAASLILVFSIGALAPTLIKKNNPHPRIVHNDMIKRENKSINTPKESKSVQEKSADDTLLTETCTQPETINSTHHLNETATITPKTNSVAVSESANQEQNDLTYPITEAPKNIDTNVSKNENPTFSEESISSDEYLHQASARMTADVMLTSDSEECVDAENSNITILSYEEYIDYLGWDMSKKNLALPEGMVLIIPDDVQIITDSQSKKIIDDVIVYSIVCDDNPQSYMTVSASLVTDHTNEYGEFENSSIINDTKVFMRGDGILKEACAEIGTVSLYVSAVNVSDAEFDAFLNTLL